LELPGQNVLLLLSKQAGKTAVILWLLRRYHYLLIIGKGADVTIDWLLDYQPSVGPKIITDCTPTQGSMGLEVTHLDRTAGDNLGDKITYLINKTAEINSAKGEEVVAKNRNTATVLVAIWPLPLKQILTYLKARKIVRELSSEAKQKNVRLKVKIAWWPSL